jgi:hypothetical protein
MDDGRADHGALHLRGMGRPVLGEGGKSNSMRDLDVTEVDVTRRGLGEG